MYPEADLPGLHEEQHCIGIALACKARVEQLSGARSSMIASRYQTAGVGHHQCASQFCQVAAGAPLTEEVGFIGQVQLDACTHVVASMGTC
jgi:hypothetical protein